MPISTTYAHVAPGNMPWWPMAAAAAALARAEVIVMHHGHRAVLVACADTATTEQMAFIDRHSAGPVRVIVRERSCGLLDPPEPDGDQLGHAADHTPANVFHDRLTAAAVALTDAAVPRSSGAVVADLLSIDDPTGRAGIDASEAFAKRFSLTLVAAPQEWVVGMPERRQRTSVLDTV